MVVDVAILTQIGANGSLVVDVVLLEAVELLLWDMQELVGQHRAPEDADLDEVFVGLSHQVLSAKTDVTTS